LRFWPRGVIEAYDPTAREREILRLVLQGASNKQIEKKLFISGSTVRNHPCNVHQKHDVNNRLELINRMAPGRAARLLARETRQGTGGTIMPYAENRTIIYRQGKSFLPILTLQVTIRPERL
jgi:DNA-binding CsgD family transcriptional regulator